MLTEEMLREQAGEDVFSQGSAIFHRALVREAKRIQDEQKDEVIYIVSDGERHLVSVSAGQIRCDCGGYPCAHGVAAALTALESGVAQDMEKHRAQLAAPAIFEAVAAMLPETDGIKLSPVLFFHP